MRWLKKKEAWQGEEEDWWVKNYCIPPLTVSDVT